MLVSPHARKTLGALAFRCRTESSIRRLPSIAANRFSECQHPRAASGTGEMASNQPDEGATTTGIFKVKPTDLASVISPDEKDVYPAVFATSRLAAFMEIVCARLLVPHLPSGQLSVGVRVDMTHLAATPVDEDVTVRATFRGKEGKLFAFDVVAHDTGGEIGKAMHTRAMVDEQRLMGGIKKRIGGESKV